MVDPEKFPTMDSLAFATPEDAKKAEAIFNMMRGRINALRNLAERLQWGSCDGCGQHDYCPLCGQQRMDIHGNHGRHAENCYVAFVLRHT